MPHLEQRGLRAVLSMSTAEACPRCPDRALGGVLRARSAPWKGLLAGSQQQVQRQLVGAAPAGGQEEQGAALLGPAVAAGGGLWFMPRKGTQEVSNGALVHLQHGRLP